MLEDAQDPHPVHHEVELRVVDGVLVREVRGQVVHDLGAVPERPRHDLLVQDVPSHEADVRPLWHVPFVCGGEVVQDHNPLRPSGGESLDQIRPNGPRASRDQDRLAFECLG